MHMLYRGFRVFLGCVAGAGALVLACSAPALALGHRGDPSQVQALRDQAPPQDGTTGSSEGAPEVDGRALAQGIALALGGVALIARRRRRSQPR